MESTRATSSDYRYRGARSLVLLHERELRAFIETWKAASAADLALGESDDPNYASLETLLRHVLWWARDYMVWACEKLGLPDPAIEPTPDTFESDDVMEDYVAHLLDRWRKPLTDVPEEVFFKSQHRARWGVEYSVEALVEHAVVHPMRHRFQLEELLS